MSLQERNPPTESTREPDMDKASICSGAKVEGPKPDVSYANVINSSLLAIQMKSFLEQIFTDGEQEKIA